MPVWRRLSARAARRRRETCSFKTRVDWLIHHWTDRSPDGPTKEELHATQGKNSCSWPCLNVFVKSGRLTRRRLDVAGHREVAGTPAATTGSKRFVFAKGAVGCSWFYPWTLVFFSRPFAGGDAGKFLKVIRDRFLNRSCYEGLLNPRQALRNMDAAGGTRILNMGSKLVPSIIGCFEKSKHI